MADVHPAEISPIAVTEFDRAPAADAAAELMPCCASRQWISQLVGGRPYGRLDRLCARSDVVLGTLLGAELAGALAGAAQQTPAGPLSSDLRAYERRFGYVFLPALAGLPSDELATTLRSRLHNDPVAEREIARVELSRIVRRRLIAAFR